MEEQVAKIVEQEVAKTLNGGGGSMQVFGSGSASGTTTGFTRVLSRFSRPAAAFYDHMTYRPFKGAPRGWQLRAGKALGIKKWSM